MHEIPIVCDVSDYHSPDYDVILPIDVVRDLQAAAGAVSVFGCVITDVCDVTTKTDHPDVEENFTENVDNLPTNEPNPGDPGCRITTLAQKQKQNPTLAPCWVQAQAGDHLSHSFVIHKDLFTDCAVAPALC